jgi:hypothetical protein
MNWEAIGAIGEIMGVLAVVATLGYLAVQIKQNTKIAEDATFRDIFTGVNNQLHAMISSENREVLFRGLIDYKQLPGHDKFLFDSLISGYFNLIESSIFANEAKLLSDETMENWGYYVRTRFLAYDGTRAWWEEAQNYFPPDMRSWIDAQIKQTDMSSDIWGIK